MAIPITMPALSPTMEEGNLTRWHVKVGDRVKPGDLIAEIETDKATMEVEAVDEGVIERLCVAEGQQGVKVNTVIAELASSEAPGRPATGQTRSSTLSSALGSAGAETAAPTGKSAERPLRPSSNGSARVYASPLARRLAQQKGIELSAIRGTGPHGRIIKADVLNHTTPLPTQVVAGAGPTSLIEPAVLDDRVYPPDSYELIPLDGVRRVTARRLTQSFMQVPHFPLTITLDIDHLLAARARINEAAAASGTKVSVNDMLIKASAMALMAHPDANASFTDRGVAQHRSAHVSVAVAIPGGLITPVVRDAQTKGLAQIAAEMKDLAARAREKKLKPQEYMGGTFSLSNLGMFGVRSFASIINPPEGMILSVGAGETCPVVRDGKIVIATVMTVTLTCDHRVVDGATGARWLQTFRQFVETPEAMLL